MPQTMRSRLEESPRRVPRPKAVRAATQRVRPAIPPLRGRAKGAAAPVGMTRLVVEACWARLGLAFFFFSAAEKSIAESAVFALTCALTGAALSMANAGAAKAMHAVAASTKVNLYIVFLLCVPS